MSCCVCGEKCGQDTCWDFVFDPKVSGSPLKWLSIVDEYTRECLALKVSSSITSEDLIACSSTGQPGLLQTGFAAAPTNRSE